MDTSSGSLGVDLARHDLVAVPWGQQRRQAGVPCANGTTKLYLASKCVGDPKRSAICTSVSVCPLTPKDPRALRSGISNLDNTSPLNLTCKLEKTPLQNVPHRFCEILTCSTRVCLKMGYTDIPIYPKSNPCWLVPSASSQNCETHPFFNVHHFQHADPVEPF